MCGASRGAESLERPLLDPTLEAHEQAEVAHLGAAGRASETLAGRRNLLQLIQLRWLAVAGQLATILAVHFLLAIRLPLVEMLTLLGALALFNVASWLHSRSGRDVSNGALFGGVLIDVAERIRAKCEVEILEKELEKRTEVLERIKGDLREIQGKREKTAGDTNALQSFKAQIEKVQRDVEDGERSLAAARAKVNGVQQHKAVQTMQ